MHKLQKSRVWKLLYQAGWEGQGRLGVFFIWADANSVFFHGQMLTLCPPPYAQPPYA